MPTRAAQEAAWLELTRVTLPALAAGRSWPVQADHCFQRILLDAVTGGVWYDAIQGRPAYRHMTDAQLAEAIMLAREVVAGVADIRALNEQSLMWRRKRR